MCNYKLIWITVPAFNKCEMRCVFDERWIIVGGLSCNPWWRGVTYVLSNYFGKNHSTLFRVHQPLSHYLIYYLRKFFKEIIVQSFTVFSIFLLTDRCWDLPSLFILNLECKNYCKILIYISNLVRISVWFSQISSFSLDSFSSLFQVALFILSCGTFIL